MLKASEHGVGDYGWPVHMDGALLMRLEWQNVRCNSRSGRMSGAIGTAGKRMVQGAHMVAGLLHVSHVLKARCS